MKFIFEIILSTVIGFIIFVCLPVGKVSDKTSERKINIITMQ